MGYISKGKEVLHLCCSDVLSSHIKAVIKAYLYWCTRLY